MRACIWVLTLLLFPWAAKGADLAEIPDGRTMGTSYTVKWIPTPDENLKATRARIQERLDRINELMSTYDPESELSRFNASGETEWFEVDPETALVVRRALEIAELSGGAFDPTVGRLVRMWSFGSGERSFVPPTDEEIREALKTVGYRRVVVRDEPPAIRKDHSLVELDLSAIAKGYGSDEIARVLLDGGVEHLFVEIGGEVVTRGTRQGRPWRVGIERPDELARSLHSTIELDDAALATSGDYRNFFEADGVRYSHTIDPTTGRPVTHPLASVTVIADDCMTADALATALMVLGPEAGQALVEKHGFKTLFLIHDGKQVRSAESLAARGRFVPLPIADERPAAAPANALMTTFVLTATVFAFAILALGLGVMFSNRPLRGSCGGASGVKDAQGRSMCDMCTTPPEECEQFREQLAQARHQDSDDDLDE